jgi:hypothetical protein
VFQKTRVQAFTSGVAARKATDTNATPPKKLKSFFMCIFSIYLNFEKVNAPHHSEDGDELYGVNRVYTGITYFEYRLNYYLILTMSSGFTSPSRNQAVPSCHRRMVWWAS